MFSRFKTVVALMRNPKVSKFPKFLVVAAIFYLLLPFDAIPDIAPVVGWLDDIMFLVGAFSLLFGSAPRPDPAPPSSSRSSSAPPSEAIVDVTPEPPSHEALK